MTITFSNVDVSHEITIHVTSLNIELNHLVRRKVDLARTALFLEPKTQIYFMDSNSKVVEITDQIRETN